MTLLVQQTLQRLRSVQQLIRSIGEHDFPYEDSQKTLDLVEQLIAEQIDTLLDQVTEDSDPSTVRTFCNRAGDVISGYLPVLGLIVRSADPIGALELQWPLQQLTKRALGDDALLVLSSDWNFSPFTLTPNELADQNVVLVGMPVSEANNVLIAPLAGHELGHNIWRKRSLEPQVHAAVVKALKEEIKDVRWEDCKNHFGLIDQNNFEVPALAYTWALLQCQEIYCDIIGLLIFRESFLHAFRYLLSADRELNRAEQYPAIVHRASILCKCAQDEKIEIPFSFEESFSNESVQVEYEPLQLMLELSDEATGRCAIELYTLAKQFVTEKRLGDTTPEGVEHVLKHFRRLMPATDAPSLQDIINAAWKFELEGGAKAIDDKSTRFTSIVAELTFKTCEVFQIERISDDSQ